MALDAETIARLNVPLNPARVVTGQSGPLNGINYLEGHDVIRAANEIFGYGQWGFEPIGQPWIVEAGTQGSKGTPYQVWACMARLTVAGCQAIVEIGTNTRQGDGSGGLEMAIKGAVTDALKRCLRMFGDQFGLILHSKDERAQNEAIEAWHEYQRQQQGGVVERTAQPEQRQEARAADGGSNPSPATPMSTPAQDAHTDPSTGEPTPKLMTRREVEAVCSRLKMGFGLIGAYIKQTNAPVQVSDAEFAEYAASPDGMACTPEKLVYISLRYLEQNGGTDLIRESATELRAKLHAEIKARTQGEVAP